MLLLLAAAVSTSVITVNVETSHVLNTVRPLRAIGTSVDSDPKGRIEFLYTPARVAPALEAGLGTISYRLYTELSIQDWHWNPTGTFSAGDRGYWTSASAPITRIVDSYGYVLPHRGDTRDQGDDNGYSRIDDGDPHTYWKSNPYLTSRYTDDPDSAHPQWVVVDLDQMHAVDAIAIRWSNPYATHYRVQYWAGDNYRTMPNGTYLQPGGVVTGYDSVDAIVDQTHGTWRDFPNGVVSAGRGGTPVLRLAGDPVQTHWVRILMDRSSGTCDSHGASDPRNCVGYAIEDVAIGLLDAAGQIHDVVRHNACGGDPTKVDDCAPHQSIIYVSSEDPWHDSSDRVRGDQDQPGLDVIATSEVTRGLPVMYPVPLWYSTPQNAANEVRYLERRHYKFDFIEMGEEVDGQYAVPEDYAALYVEFAKAIHAVDPSVKLGGPVFEGVNIDVPIWADAAGDRRWFHRFLLYLKSHGHLGDLAFMSYEHYPFHGCDQGGALFEDLLQEPALVKSIVDMWRADGLPAGVPTFMTEDNFANDGGPVPKQLEGALWMADWIGSALSDGVTGVNYYQIESEPTGFKRECRKFGGYGPLIVDDNWRILGHGAQFYAAQMLTKEWFAFGDAPQPVYAASSDLGSTDVTQYAAKRADGAWSLMFVNKDDVQHRVRIEIGGVPLNGRASVTTFGAAQYFWSGDKLAPPARDLGLAHSTATGPTYLIPARSITVIRIRS